MAFKNFVSIDQPLLYTIQFQNEITASAPAQVVIVSTTLDSAFDFSTFEVGSFGFGKTQVEVPAGRTAYSTRVDARSTVGAYVDVSATVNLATGVASWRFTTIDPDTGLLTGDPLAGFLPPDVTPPQGDGFVTYRVRPKVNATSGTVVGAQGRVIFDTNAPLDTLIVTNTLDASSAVQLRQRVACEQHYELYGDLVRRRRRRQRHCVL